MREDPSNRGISEIGAAYRNLPARLPRSLPLVASRDVGRGGIKFMGRTISGGAPTVALYPEDRDWGYHDDGTTVYLVYNRLGVINYIPLVDLATQAELDAKVPIPVTGTPNTGDVPTATSASTATWQTPPIPQSGWTTAPTGTLTRTTFASYAGQTVSNPPTQVEMQAIDDHLKIVSQRLAALITDLRTRGSLIP